MQAVWLENNSLSVRYDLPVPNPPTGEALLSVDLAGICATDLEMVKGYYPFTGIPGHEFVGTVMTVSDQDAVSQTWVGKRVVGEINAACGTCPACKAGRPTHCERRSVLGIAGRQGVFADYVTLPVENLHPVPDRVPDEVAVFVEPLAAALEIQEQVFIRPTDQVLVIGAGRLGQLIAWTLALTGCDIQVVARRSRQQELLRKRGIQAILPEQVPTKKFDLVVEATGTPDGFYLARQAIRPRGTVVLKSTYKGDLLVNFSAIVVDEITLVGSRCGPFAPALVLLDTGRIDPHDLIETTYPLSEALAGFESAAQPGILKILIKPGMN